MVRKALMERQTFNLLVRKNLADAFDKWALDMPGNKGQKTDAALIAILALSRISPHLVHDLMRADISVEAARKLITDAVVDAYIAQFQESLSPQQKARILRRARQDRDKISQNPKG